MPEAAKHLKQANHNEELIQLISSQKKEAYFSDWYVTVAFYTSLHYIETIIFNKRVFNINKSMTVKGKHSSDFKTAIGTGSEHVVRSKLIYHNPEIFDKIYIPYGNLHEMSRTARYDCHETPSNEFIDAEECLADVKKAFQEIAK
jgi:hypothetical protein